jgi:hypothetical protein
MVAKTPLFSTTRARLVALNDHLYYMTLADEQLVLHLAPAIGQRPEAFTTDIFPASGRALRLHVRLRELGGFRALAISAGIGALFSASYEALLSYMHGAERILASLGRLTGQPVRSAVPEDGFEDLLRLAGVASLPREVRETLNYLRLRRNQVTHGAEEPTDALATLARQRGTHLTRYWRLGGCLDFSAPSRPEINEEDAVELLKLCRYCLDPMDAAVASGIEPAKVVRYLDSQLLGRRPDLRDPSRRVDRARKVTALAANEFGLVVDADSYLDPSTTYEAL